MKDNNLSEEEEELIEERIQDLEENPEDGYSVDEFFEEFDLGVADGGFEDMIEDMSDEELLEEYRAVSEHLHLCRQLGQVDIKQRRWRDAVKQEIILRMGDEQ
jgi:hypothetical protein